MTMLTQERLKEVLDYDPETGIFRWRKAPGQRTDLVGKEAGNHQENGYLEIGVDGERYLAHRLAWFYVHGEWPVGKTDHQNRVRHDNRLVNLRSATDSQNCMNKDVQKNNTSGYPGVVWDKSIQRWRARIQVDGKLKYLGAFKSFDAAVFRRGMAEEEFFGEYAKDAA